MYFNLYFRYTAAHTLDLYSEVAAICRPPLVLAPADLGSLKKSQTPHTGYIISVYKVFEGDDGERFERNWLYWTGARMLYRLINFDTNYLLSCTTLKKSKYYSILQIPPTISWFTKNSLAQKCINTR